MNNRIEHFGRDIDSQKTRASGQFSGVEVAAFLQRTGHFDVRRLGCPDHIFDEIFRKNAERRGLKPQSRQADSSIERAVDDHLSDRLEAATDRARDLALIQTKPF